MEKEAEDLMVENISKNMSDADEYPAMVSAIPFINMPVSDSQFQMNMHTRCISILANLWHAQKGEKSIGTATTGTIQTLWSIQV